MSSVPSFDYLLERFRHGEVELSSLEKQRAAERLPQLDDSDREILERVPPHLFARRVSAAIGDSPAWSTRYLTFAPAVGAVCALLLIFYVATSRGVRADEENLLKGHSDRIFAFRQTATGVEQLQDGSVANAGDLIQIQYSVGPKLYIAVVSIDGTGNMTVHLPTAGEEAVYDAAGGRHALEHSFKLDDAPKFERFFLVSSPVPFLTSDISEKARHAALGSTTLSERMFGLNFQQSTLVLMKGMRP